MKILLIMLLNLFVFSNEGFALDSVQKEELAVKIKNKFNEALKGDNGKLMGHNITTPQLRLVAIDYRLEAEEGIYFNFSRYSEEIVKDDTPEYHYEYYYEITINLPEGDLNLEELINENELITMYRKVDEAYKNHQEEKKLQEKKDLMSKLYEVLKD